MRLAIEVRLIDADAPAVLTLLIELERLDAQLDPSTLGLTPQEGR